MKIKCLITLVACAASSFATNILYLEDFANTANGNNFNTGWNWGNADALLTSTVVDGVGVRHETWSHSPLGATGVNNFPAPGSVDIYGVPFTPFNGATSRFMYTLEVGDLGITTGDILSFRADIRKNENQNRIWFGVMTDNVWYFTENTLIPTLDDGTGLYVRYEVPMVNMVQINQVYDGTAGWGVDRTVSEGTIVGPANFVGTESVDGFALLFTTNAGEIGNLYMDNLGLVAIPEPATVALLMGLSAFALVFYMRRRR